MRERAEKVEKIMEVIDYIETHLHEKLDLERIAREAHYSKYHLHRMFTEVAGLTIQTYVQRRQLTEAAKMLAFSERPILEIALSCGYESQQSFTDSFKSMYKKPSHQYRKEAFFYPLQLRWVLQKNPGNTEENDWRDKMVFAGTEDINEWMNLVWLVIDGYPYLEERAYLRRLQEYIHNRRALMIKNEGRAIGIMAFHELTGSIDFMGVHPQYRKKGITEAFCTKALYELAQSSRISVTTFREGDRADTGYRKAWKSLGFVEAEGLVEFGYPTQRLVLKKEEARLQGS